MDLGATRRTSGHETAKYKLRVAIVGGGPGGLFTAWHLEAKAGDSCEITIFEASSRVGGKIVTRHFAGAGPYEAGVAEIYDYSRTGPDPLRDLIVKELKLGIKYIDGGPCVLDGKVILTPDDLAEHFGERARDEVKRFRARCAKLLNPTDYYLSVAEVDNTHPWSRISGEALLNQEIKDDAARRYVRVMAHSDVAAPPHQTNGLTFLKNVVMDVEGYMDIFSVVGGNEQIVDGLVERIDATIRINSNVRSVEPLSDGTYRLHLEVNGICESADADVVVVAVPLSALSTINWRSEAMQEVVDRHVAYLDRPGHYLRATLLFKRPFWREHLLSHWWMLDAFDGCCVYDESSRNDFGGYGALAFLIAGNAALCLANVEDERIEQLCLDALPPALAEGKKLIVDRRIHRWMASVNAIPGGMPVRKRSVNHHPDPERLPGLLMVGDYIFDATLNGVLDSADAATDVIVAEILKRRRSQDKNQSDVIQVERWAKARSTEEVLLRFLPADTLADMIQITWGVSKGARILHLGAASGQLVLALRRMGYDAVGVEWNRHAHLVTPSEVAQFNKLCEPNDLPFGDRAFDVVVETGLCRLPSEQATAAIGEIRRVAKRGMVLGSITIDKSIELLERHELLEGVATLASRWDWSERLYAVGFTHALMNSPRLDDVWKRAQISGAGPGYWYEDPESVLYCFYEPGRRASVARVEDEGTKTAAFAGPNARMAVGGDTM